MMLHNKSVLIRKGESMVKMIVVGSSAIDLVVTAKSRPKKGETIIGETFKTIPGGKGANQAISGSRLGAEVIMMGCVGTDSFGEEILNNLSANNICTRLIERKEGVESGTAHITLAENDNSIIVIKGANEFITPSYIKKHVHEFKSADIVLIQQENPEETVDYVVSLCYELKVPVILNPAPARKVKEETIRKATYLTPNEHEANTLFGVDDYRQILSQYPNKVFVTEGEGGVRYHDGRMEIVIPTYEVEVVDTTGAGDTFNAAFAVALAKEQDIHKSLKFANRAASLSVTKFGAQGGMPTREEVERELVE